MLMSDVGSARGYVCPCAATLSDGLTDGCSLAMASSAGAAPPGTLGPIAVAQYHHRHERRMVKGQLAKRFPPCLAAHVGRLVGTSPCNATLSEGLTDGWTLARASSAGAAPPDTLGSIAMAPYHHRYEQRMKKRQLTETVEAASLLMSVGSWVRVHAMPRCLMACPMNGP